MSNRIVPLRGISRREKKVNSLLEHEIGKIISREIGFPEGAMATLTHVSATPNLIEARVFISVFPEEKADKVLGILKNNVYNIQQKINKTLRMRPIPKIIFTQDFTTSRAGRVEELLAKVEKNSKN